MRLVQTTFGRLPVGARFVIGHESDPLIATLRVRRTKTDSRNRISGLFRNSLVTQIIVDDAPDPEVRAYLSADWRYSVRPDPVTK